MSFNFNELEQSALMATSVAASETEDAYGLALRRLLRVTSSPRFGLGRMEELLQRLGEPHHRFSCLHVAGTNGKGSTCAFLDAALAELGIPRGLSTSPHLSSARERIRIEGELISMADFIDLEKVVNAAASQMLDPPTFFERMTAMAFLAFAESGIEVAVVEVGLGGRLDATNLVRPLACGITRLGLDHQQFLGPRLVDIAGEKAGIFKADVPARSVAQNPDAMEVIQSHANTVRSPFRQVNDDEMREAAQLSLQLVGAHQRENAALALSMLRAAGLGGDRDRTHLGLCKAFWPGRFENVREEGRVWLDGAHNPAAAHVLVQALKDEERTRDRPIYLLIGMTQGHEAAGFAEALRGLPLRQCRAVRARAPRSVVTDELVVALQQGGLDVRAAPSWRSALTQMQAEAERENGIILVTGSLYLVGEVRAHLMGMPADPELPEF